MQARVAEKADLVACVGAAQVFVPPIIESDVFNKVVQ